MKLRRSREHRRIDPTVPAHVRVEATSEQHRAAPRLRNGRPRLIRVSYGLAAPALVGALLLSFAEGIPSVGAAQTTSPGKAEEAGAAFSIAERLRLTLALARTYRLTDQPQRALDTLAPLSAGRGHRPQSKPNTMTRFRGMRMP
jgi:hypothetical protein